MTALNFFRLINLVNHVERGSQALRVPTAPEISRSISEQNDPSELQPPEVIHPIAGSSSS